MKRRSFKFVTLMSCCLSIFLRGRGRAGMWRESSQEVV